MKTSIKIINIDSLTYAGNLNNLASCSSNPNLEFVKGDICDSALLRKIFESKDIDAVINFAAESHVDKSISNSNPFISTNINGILAL